MCFIRYVHKYSIMLIKTKLIPAGFQAVTIWPFIVVLPEHATNPGLIEHEMVHYREQSWITAIWWVRYVISKSFRQAAEVRAYKRQIEVGGISVETAANMLLCYRLGITYDQAYALLTA